MRAGGPTLCQSTSGPGQRRSGLQTGWCTRRHKAAAVLLPCRCAACSVEPAVQAPIRVWRSMSQPRSHKQHDIMYLSSFTQVSNVCIGQDRMKQCNPGCTCHVHLFLASAMVVLVLKLLMLAMRRNANRENAAHATRDSAAHSALPLT